MTTPSSSVPDTRREFLRRTGAFSLAAMMASLWPSRARAQSHPAPAPAETATGLVFADLRGDGLAAGQAGLPGVLVTNGEDVVATDSAGRYQLPVREHAIISVIKPRGYRPPLDAQNLPRFHYIHKPSGSPDAKFIYKGVPPTGPLPASIDFPLIPQDEPDSFEMIFTADPQPYELRHVEWYARECLPEFRASGAAFGVALGDIVGDHLDLYQPYNAANVAAGFPWYHVIGNHDLNYMAREDAFAAETFKKTFGPDDYAFTYARVHFIVLNNIFWEGYTRLRADGWPRRGQYQGRLRPRQLAWLRQLVSHIPVDERIVVCTHIPLVNQIDAELPAHATPEYPELLRILSGHPHTISFSGHTHVMMNYESGPADGYGAPGGALHRHCNLGATCGSWYRGPRSDHGIPFAPGRDGSPRGYALVRFDGARACHVRFKALGRSPDYQMRVTLPDRLPVAELAVTAAAINVFNATPRTRVRWRLGAGPWRDATRTTAPDPYYVNLAGPRDPDAPDRDLLPEPIATSHLWSAPLPADLTPGWHQASFEAHQPDGEIWSAQRDFHVIADAASMIRYDQGSRVPRATVG